MSAPRRVDLAGTMLLGLAAFAIGAASAFRPVEILLALAALLVLGVAVYFFKDPVAVLIGFFAFEVIQVPLAALVGYSNAPGRLVLQADEAMLAGLLVLAVLYRLDKPSDRPIGRYVAAGGAFAVAGLASAVLQHVPPGVAAVGGWLQVKWWVLLAVALMLPWRAEDKDRVLKALMIAGLTLAALGLVDLVAQQPFRALLHTSEVSVTFDPRSSRAVQSVFTTPAQFSIVMAMLTVVAVAARVGGRPGRYGLYAVIFAVMALLSLRISALFAVTAGTFVVLMLGRRSFEKRLVTVMAFAVLIVMLGFLSRTQINSHLTTYAAPGTTARGLLYTTSGTLSREHFPLGSGFGTFASAESRLQYSPLYYEYGLADVYGLSSQYPQFIDDTMWPAILGEGGYVGLVAILVGLFALARAFLRRLGDRDAGETTFALAGVGLLVVVVINSIANPVMFSGLNSVIFALIAAPALLSGRTD